ncbi:unnamed protein product, partial [Thlaspi arvense]
RLRERKPERSENRKGEKERQRESSCLRRKEDEREGSRYQRKREEPSLPNHHQSSPNTVAQRTRSACHHSSPSDPKSSTVELNREEATKIHRFSSPSLTVRLHHCKLRLPNGVTDSDSQEEKKKR